MKAARLGLPAALFLSGACVLSYANGLTGAFCYDDKAIVRDNLRIRSPERLDEIFTTQYFGGRPGTGTAYRPVLLLSYAVQWWAHGGSVVGFHAVNVLLHVAVTLTLAALLLRLGLPPPLAVGAALFFAVLPIHVEAVTSVVGRGETLAALFVLLGLRLALDAAEGLRPRGMRLLGALGAYALACLTKESAAVTPALFGILLLFRAEGSLARRVREALVRALPFAVGAAAVLRGVFRLRTAVLGGALHAAATGIFEVENPLAPLPPGVRAANAAAVFFRYLGRMALPLRLSSDESAWSIAPLGPRDAVFWIAPVLLAVLVVAALARLRSRSPSALGFLLLAAAFLPTANLLFPTGTIFGERLAYLPSAGFCVVLASWIAGPARTLSDLSGRRTALLAAVAFAYAARAVARNPVWASDEALFTDMVRVSPESAKAHYDFAYMAADNGRNRQALEHYGRAIAIYPKYWDAWAGKGRMERLLGDLDASEKSYAEALRLVPTYENGFYGLGLAKEERGDRGGAEAVYRRGLQPNPQSLPLAYRMAVVLSAENRPNALFAWRRALAIEPGSLPTRLGFADWLLAAGRRDEALAQVRETLRLSPRHRPALERLEKLSR
ncbi:MAG TPA: tetratricopeptide repeat protein [Thermoanaerobaculia bacterium]|nr:tetratricopeptide repeat protein [Thermoanaerobaculia bacterium]